MITKITQEGELGERVIALRNTDAFSMIPKESREGMVLIMNHDEKGRVVVCLSDADIEAINQSRIIRGQMEDRTPRQGDRQS